MFAQKSISRYLEVFGWFVLYPLRNHNKLKLIVVMIVIPGTLNSIQFWVQDNFLKLTKHSIENKEVETNCDSGSKIGNNNNNKIDSDDEKNASKIKDNKNGDYIQVLHASN